MLHVADLLDATVWEPDEEAKPTKKTLSDFVLSTPPPTAALAEKIAVEASNEDLVFCNSEAISLAVAARLIKTRKRTTLASLVHNLERPRIKLLMRTTGAVNRHAALYCVSPLLAASLKKRFAANGPHVELIREQIDDKFFTPGPSRKKKSRPMIIAVGLEQRDYHTLAAATRDLDLDVAISAFSKDAKATARSAPEQLPANMDIRFYEWTELAQLYRDADIIVVPLHQNGYAAGITSILEASAARRPVIATATAGLKGAFADEETLQWVPPGNTEALRRKIQLLLADMSACDTLATRAAEAYAASHTEDQKVAEMAARLKAL